MFVILSSVCVVASLYITFRPLINFLRDEKGLRKYPTQNSLSGISASAYGWEVGRKHAVFHTRRLHEALMKNPIIRLGPNWLSFGRSKAVKDIYGYTSPCLKADIYDSLQGGGKHLVNISDKFEHSHRRRMVAAAYAPKNIEAWEPAVADSVARLLKQMDAMCTAPLPPNTVPKQEDIKFEAMLWSNLFAFETVIKIGLSKDVHFVDSGSDHVEIGDSNGVKVIDSVESLHGGSRATSTLIWDTPWFPLYKKLSIALFSGYKLDWQRGTDWGSFMKKLTLERIERYNNGEILDDLFAPMMEDKKGVSADIDTRDRIAEVNQMVNGGGDGPAISLCNTLYYLVKNPHAMAALRKELDSVLDPTDIIAPWAKVKNLPYLKACINESMRLSPPVATDLVRYTPPQGLNIDGQMIPGKTIVSISAYTAHRDPEVFSDPEAFWPERWLGEAGDNMSDMVAVYIPFSSGSRSCIGRNVSILQQAAFLATLCHRYDFALPSRDWEMVWEDYFNLWPKELPLKIWQRNPEALA